MGDTNLTLPQNGQSSTYDYYLNKLGNLLVPDAIYKDLVLFLVLEKKIFKCYMGMAAILVNGPCTFI